MGDLTKIQTAEPIYITDDGTKSLSFGQTTMASSLPVVIASDQIGNFNDIVGDFTSTTAGTSFTITTTCQYGGALLSFCNVGNVTGNPAFTILLHDSGFTDYAVPLKPVDGSNIIISGTVTPSTSVGSVYWLDISGSYHIVVRCITAQTSNTVRLSSTIFQYPNMIEAQANISHFGNTAISIGQATMASSMPVVVASNQSDIGVNVDKVGGASVVLGQTTMANSLPTVQASDQIIGTAVSGSGAQIATVTGFNGVLVSVTGTFDALVISFWLDDGSTTYKQCSAIRADGSWAGKQDTTSTNTAWYVNCAGATHFKTQQDALSSGSYTCRIVPFLQPLQSSVQGVNITNIGGTALALGAQNATGCIPVVQATDTAAPVNLNTYGGVSTTLGSKVSASSIPVVPASDWVGAANITKIGGTTVVLGQSTMAASMPVVIASNQSDIGVNVDKMGGASVVLGQSTMAASIPAVMASDQLSFTSSTSFTNAVSIGGGTSWSLGGRYNSVLLNFYGLYTSAPAYTFQLGDGGDTNNYPVLAHTLDGSSFPGSTVTLPTNTSKAFWINTTGAQYLDIVTAATIATGTCHLFMSATMNPGVVEANANIGQVGGTAIAAGQTTMAASIPTVIASDQKTGISAMVHNQTSIGTTAVQLASNVISRGAVVRSLSTNAGTIYVGITGVTTSTGYELLSGQAVYLPVSNTNVIYCIASQASQTVCWIGV